MDCTSCLRMGRGESTEAAIHNIQPIINANESRAVNSLHQIGSRFSCT